MYNFQYYPMSFDYNSINVDNDPAGSFDQLGLFPGMIDDDNELGFREQDIVVVHDAVLTATFEKGYIDADKFYALHPEKYLKIKGFDGFFSCGTRYCGNCGDYQVVEIEAGTDFDDVSIQNICADKIERFENSPILVFQHHIGPITLVNESGMIFTIDEEILSKGNCKNDMTVFRGVFTAKHNEGDRYRLTKVFDRFYFR